MRKLSFIGSAFGGGAQVLSTEQGPIYMKEHYQIEKKLRLAAVESHWYAQVIDKSQHISQNNIKSVLMHNGNLYKTIQSCMNLHPLNIPIIIGGDHSCATGTWTSIVDNLQAINDFGLIWIDAHMDAHTYHTSPSKAYHGMPLSVLLGYGSKKLQSLGSSVERRINPKLLVLIGVRSYESAEEKYLKDLGVTVIMMEEIYQKGLEEVFIKALLIVSNAKKGFGISLDLDAIDPIDAPGVNSSEYGGLRWSEMQTCLSILFKSNRFKAMEIAEFDPLMDQNDVTAEIIYQISSMIGFND